MSTYSPKIATIKLRKSDLEFLQSIGEESCLECSASTVIRVISELMQNDRLPSFEEMLEELCDLNSNEV